MGGSGSKPSPPVSTPVPDGKVRICMAGLKLSHHTGRARHIATRLANMRPEMFETWFYYDSSDNYYAFLNEKFDAVPFPAHLKGHSSSPFCWIEQGPRNEITPIGGRDCFCEWVEKTYPEIVETGGDEFKKLLTTGPNLSDAFHNKEEWAMTASVTIAAPAAPQPQPAPSEEPTQQPPATASPAT